MGTLYLHPGKYNSPLRSGSSWSSIRWSFNEHLQGVSWCLDCKTSVGLFAFQQIYSRNKLYKYLPISFYPSLINQVISSSLWKKNCAAEGLCNLPLAAESRKGVAGSTTPVPWATLTLTLLSYLTSQVLSPYPWTDFKHSQEVKDI